MTNIATGTSGSYTWASGDTPGFSKFLMAEAGGGGNAPTAVTLQSISANSNTAVLPILIAALLLALIGGAVLRRRVGIMKDEG